MPLRLMVTDWVLFRRAAGELDAALRGAKVRDAGRTADGRIGLALHRRGSDAVLAFDPFGSPPIFTLEPPGSLRAEPGFVRSLGDALRGSTFLEARVRRGDRLVRMLFGTRSRFGVGDELELFAELVPRFGNLVLVKNGTVVAAAKEFSLAENATRAVAAGLRYEPPPARPGTIVPKAVLDTGSDPDVFLSFAESDEALRVPLYVYRDGSRPLAAHLIALPQFGTGSSREASLLALFSEVRASGAREGAQEATAHRRAALEKRLAERERKLRSELARIGEKRDKALARHAQRDEGERIFALLHELEGAERDAAKDRAAKLFAQYKKLGASLPHLDERESTVRTALEAVEALRWETQRTGDDLLEDVESAAGYLDAGRRRVAPARRKRSRPLLEYRTASGSRILIGRSPAENAAVTFEHARPNDLWFHAQGVPGAHVILARDDREEPPAQDIESAAKIAALYSKAKASAKVPVDYTSRKNVRKQREAPPGLVWYVHPKTVVVAPGEPEGSQVSG